MQQPKRRRPAKGSRLPAATDAAAATLVLPLLLLLLLAFFGAAAAQQLAPSPPPSAAAAAPAHAASGHAMAPSQMTAAHAAAAPAAAPAAAVAAAVGGASSSATATKPGKEEASLSPSPVATSTSSTSTSTSSTSTSTSASTVCPSIARSPTRHVTLVVTRATYILADAGGKAGASKGAMQAAPPRLLEGMLAVNGSVLGPTLEFEEGEDVSIDVVNGVADAAAAPGGSDASTTATSVHWHGLDLPGAAWADGVAGVTQRPVPQGVSFRYRFKAGPVGTHWYHAHTGLQYADGLRGALIVRPRGGAAKRKSDVGAGYDEERLLVVSDQAATTAERVYEELQAGTMSMATMQAGGAGAHGGGGGGGGGGDGMEAASPGSSAAAASGGAKAAAHGRRRRRGLSQAAAPNGGGAGKGGMEGMAMSSSPPPSAPSPSSSPSEPSVDPQSGCFDSTTTQDISDAPYYATLVNGKGFALVSSSESGQGPPAFAGAPAVVEVKRGKKYRFRLVNAGASWGYNVSVDRHPIALLALDGYPLAVSKADSGRKGGSGSGSDSNISAAGLRAVAGVVTTPGETVDFLLDASAPDGVRNYWINVLTITGFGGPAVLHYEGAPDPFSEEGKRQLGPPPTLLGCAYARDAAPRVADLKNATNVKGLLLSPRGAKKPPRGRADRTLALVMSPNFSPADAGGAPPANFSEVATGFFDSFGGGNGGDGRGNSPSPSLLKPPTGGCRAPAGGDGKPSKYCWGINWVEFEAPAVPAIFEGRVTAAAAGKSEKKTEDNKANAPALSPSPLAAAAAAAAAASAAARREKGDFSDYRVPLPRGAVVDLVFLNPSAMVHPMHIHGTGGWLVSSGNGRPPLREDGSLDAADARVDLSDPPRRSTVPVPNAAPGLGDGFAVLRFVVDNEGPFPMHCHIDYHAEGGMFMYFVFGGEGEGGGRGSSANATAPWEIPPDLDCEAATAAAAAAEASPAKGAGGNSSVVLLSPFEDSSWSLPQIK